LNDVDAIDWDAQHNPPSEGQFTEGPYSVRIDWETGEDATDKTAYLDWSTARPIPLAPAEAGDQA